MGVICPVAGPRGFSLEALFRVWSVWLPESSVSSMVIIASGNTSSRGSTQSVQPWPPGSALEPGWSVGMSAFKMNSLKALSSVVVYFFI